MSTILINRSRRARLMVWGLRAAMTIPTLLLALTACSKTDDDAGVARASAKTVSAAGGRVNVLDVKAGDFFFRARQTVPAGMTTIRLVDTGNELHHVQLVKLAAGHTVQELVAGLGHEGPLPAWATLVGGPNAPTPAGGTSEATVKLEAGEYALICLIPGADGVPHVMKGMVLPVTVTAPTGETTAPTADVKMALRDYAFDLPATIPAGRHTIRIENTAAQPHEAFIVQLAPGKTAAEMLTWVMKRQGPPPGRPVGGVSIMSHGEVAYVTADLEAGQYALFCFAPDAQDGQPHVAHGMMREFTVR